MYRKSMCTHLFSVGLSRARVLTGWWILAAIVAVQLFGNVSCSPQPAGGYDLVIQDGRVLDPESNIDAVHNIGILAGTVQAITSHPLKGKMVIDTTGPTRWTG